MNDRSDRGLWVRSIIRNTELLKTQADPVLERIRHLLAQSGVDLDDTLVANIMPEDTNVVSGFLVTADERVYEFEFDWRHKSPDSGHLAVWRDITQSYDTRAFREPISVALAMVRGKVPTG